MAARRRAPSSRGPTRRVEAIDRRCKTLADGSDDRLGRPGRSRLGGREATGCGPAEVDRAVEVADERRQRWSWTRVSVAERAGVLFGAADWMRQGRLEIAALEVFEAGKGWADADGDVCEAIDYLRVLRPAACSRSTRAVTSSRRLARRTGSPTAARGVCGRRLPWNFPLAIPTGMTCAALVAGNAVVFKPAEQTPAVAAELVSGALRSGAARKTSCPSCPASAEEPAPRSSPIPGGPHRLHRIEARSGSGSSSRPPAADGRRRSTPRHRRDGRQERRSSSTPTPISTRPFLRSIARPSASPARSARPPAG